MKKSEFQKSGTGNLTDPEIRQLSEKKLVGQHLRMSLADNRTYELWSRFMPLRNEIKGRVSDDLISMQVYDQSYDFMNINPGAQFEKWASAEVNDFSMVPFGMETFILPGGLYAVFIHRGPASEGEKTFRYIFGTWLPLSGYEIDQRPHFEILGTKYKNNDPASEEEVWIPVKPVRSL